MHKATWCAIHVSAATLCETLGLDAFRALQVGHKLVECRYVYVYMHCAFSRLGGHLELLAYYRCWLKWAIYTSFCTRDQADSKILCCASPGALYSGGFGKLECLHEAAH